MKKNLIRILVSMPFIGINWAAIHDIMSDEPNVYSEYGVVFTSLALMIFLLVNRYINIGRGSV